MTLSELFTAYCADTHALSKGAWYQYRSRVRAYVQSLPADAAPSDITAEGVSEYLQTLTCEKNSGGMHYAAIRHFTLWLQQRGLRSEPVTIRRVKQWNSYTEHPEVTERDLNALYVACRKVRGGPYQQSRYRVALCLAAFVGLKRAEIVALRVSDLDRDKNTLHISGKAERVLIVPSEVTDCICTMLSLRKEVTEDAPLLANLRGRPLTEHNVRSILNTLNKHAGLEHRFTFGTLRHACAVQMQRNGMSVEMMLKYFGRTDDSVTSKLNMLYYIKPPTARKAKLSATQVEKLTQPKEPKPLPVRQKPQRGHGRRHQFYSIALAR